MSEVNKVIRLLEGKRLRFTTSILLKDGRRLEIQHDKLLEVYWHPDARDLMLSQKFGYDNSPVVRWGDVAMMDTEENPEMKGTT